METAGQNTKQVMEENDALKQLMELLNQQNTGFYGGFLVCGGYAGAACRNGG